MTVMTKRGSLDNVVTYQHVCDSIQDLEDIKPSQITLGSIALVINGTNGLEIYIADSSKEWHALVS